MILLVLLLSVILFSGCVGPGPEPEKPGTGDGLETNKTTNKTQVAEPPKASVYLPLHLKYRFPINVDDNGVEKEVLDVDYYFDQQKDCAGKNALTGIMYAAKEGAGDQFSAWYKTTLYLDDGTSAISGELNQGELMFDDTKSKMQEFVLPLLMNEWFATGGKNFGTDAVWSSTTPTIVKNVNVFGSLGDISVVKGEEKTINSFKCTEFLVAAKVQGGFSGITKVCVMKPDKNIPQPFVVSMKIESEGWSGGPRYELKEMDNAKPPVQYFPECMEPVKCVVLPSPTNNEYNACNAKNGSMEQVRDDKNCIIQYICKTKTEMAIGDLLGGNMQCPQPSEELIKKYSYCRWEKGGPWDVQRDQNSCPVSVVCE